MKIDYAARARSLIGVRFRPQGRGPDGLDCVGVILTTFGVPADQMRSNYALRGKHLNELREGLARFFREVRKRTLRTGDVMLLQAGEEQPHLAVRTERGFVHAHAGIRRVVETPGMPEWPLLGVFRKRSR